MACFSTLLSPPSSLLPLSQRLYNPSMPSRIGTLRETHLHAALKQHYARPGDVLETPVDGFVADIRRGDALIEIQTGSFSALRRKLPRLLEQYQVLLVHPVAVERWLINEDAAGARTRRKSPRHGAWRDVFGEMVSLAELAAHPNFALEVVLVKDEQVRVPAPPPKRRRRWRARQWHPVERRLLSVEGAVRLVEPVDYLSALPPGLAAPFTNRDLAGALKVPAWSAARITYCLRKMGAITDVGRKGRAVLYAISGEMATTDEG